MSEVELAVKTVTAPSFRFVSFRFVSFRFVSFRFVSFVSMGLMPGRRGDAARGYGGCTSFDRGFRECQEEAERPASKLLLFSKTIRTFL